MNSILNAEASAGKVLSGTEKEHSIGRNSSDQGNNPAENKTEEPLSEWEQVKLIQMAMNQHHRRNFNEWASDDLGSLLSPYKEGASLNSFVEFFRDLLLFISKPKISPKFDESVPRGLDMIKLLSDFFLELQCQTGYEEFAVYHSLHHFHDDDKGELLAYAKEYLTGDDLRRVLAANGKQVVGTTPVQPKKSLFEKLDESTLEHDRAYFKKFQDGPHESKYFKTEKDLIAALDRFYPGHRWPTDKAQIVKDRLMVENLDRMEEDRLKIQSETLDQKKKRLATDAVRHVLNLPAVGLTSVSTRKPTGAVMPKQPNKATSPANKATTQNKKA